MNPANALYVVFDNRDRKVLWTGQCERALLAEQESTHDGNEPFMVCRELREALPPDQLMVDENFRVRDRATGRLVER